MGDVMVLPPDQDTDSRPVETADYETYESPVRREALIQAIFFAPAERDEHQSRAAQPAAIAA